MTTKKTTFTLSLAPIILLVALLVLNVKLFGDNSSYGPNQIALLLTAAFIAMIGYYKLKIPYKELESKAMTTVSVATAPITILLIVGALIGIWILNGVVPSMIYYGVQFISPEFFLPVCLLICSLVSLATGSSWSTVGTVGIALMGIGQTLGISDGMIAGAIVSGAYFGDKMSPLSDTTNLAPAMAQVDLFDHIKHMAYTTVPAFSISFIIFIILGFNYQSSQANLESIENISTIIYSSFYISPWLFLLPLCLFYLVKRKLPAIPTLLMGCVLGVLFALVFQKDLLLKMSSSYDFESLYKYISSVAFDGFKMDSGHAQIDKLFSRGGMSSMLNTMWIIFMAMIFGGMMEVTGMLKCISDKVLTLVKSTGSLVASTLSSAVFLNLTTSDQYISIVVTGRMFKDAYKEFGLKGKNLSRAVEDGATVTSVLVPWNTCGAYFSSVMGVATLTYLPFAFFNYLCPIISLILGITGKTIELENKEAA